MWMMSGVYILNIFLEVIPWKYEGKLCGNEILPNRINTEWQNSLKKQNQKQTCTYSKSARVYQIITLCQEHEDEYLYWDRQVLNGMLDLFINSIWWSLSEKWFLCKLFM